MELVQNNKLIEVLKNNGCISKIFDGKCCGRDQTFLKLGLGLTISTSALIWIYKRMLDLKERRYFASLVKQKQTEREEQFNKLHSEYKWNSETMEPIIKLSLGELIRKLQTRELTSVQVLEAYIAKALVATDELNCVTEFNPKAMEIARQLDMNMGDVKGPLHGVPFCVKDDTHVAGMDSTVGFARNVYHPATESAIIVQTLEELGAIPFCRTNLPQSCISFASHNPIFGQTLNPIDKTKSPGGSSSGTGALVGFGGALFGIGTDTGGSARVPAHFCGLSTIKPSKNRVSRKGCLQCIQHCIGLTTTPCIMAKNAIDVIQIFKEMIPLHNKYDAKAVPLPWNETVFSAAAKPLRIGFYTSLPVFPSLGDTAETIQKAKSLLESLGHTLIPFELPESLTYSHLIQELSFADLGQHLYNTLKNDQVSPVIKELYQTGQASVWKRKLICSLPSWLTGQSKEWYAPGLKVAGSNELWDCMAKRHDEIEKFLERMRIENLDLILCPVWPFPALNVDDIDSYTLVAGMYTFIYNFLDLPAGVVQIGSKESGQHLNDNLDDDKDVMRARAKRTLRSSIGMPIGVQIVGKPFQEELVLKVMVELEKAVSGKKLDESFYLLQENDSTSTNGD